MTKRCMPVMPKLVALMMGVVLSFVVSLPTSAYEYTVISGNNIKVSVQKIVGGKIVVEGKAAKLCSNTHCGTKADAVHQLCNWHGWKGGHVVGVADKNCFCKCSCLAGWTLITMADNSKKRIDQLLEGDVIAVMGLGGLKTAVVYAVTKSVVNNYLAYQIAFDNGKTLTGSENHAIIGEDDELVTFDSLNIGDQVRQFDGKLITVIAKEEVNYERLELFNIITNEDSALALDHLIVTEGVFSADWLLQTNNDVSEKAIEILWDQVDLSYVPQPLPENRNN